MWMMVTAQSADVFCKLARAAGLLLILWSARAECWHCQCSLQFVAIFQLHALARVSTFYQSAWSNYRTALNKCEIVCTAAVLATFHFYRRQGSAQVL